MIEWTETRNLLATNSIRYPIATLAGAISVESDDVVASITVTAQVYTKSP
jgi:hypothetical protein